MKPIKVAIVDDQVIFRQAIRKLLVKQPDLCVVAEAEDGLAAIRIVEELQPDAVTMDISMPVMGGLEATKIITSRFPEVRVIVLSMNSGKVVEAMSSEAGACHCLCKDCSPKEILSAIRKSRGNP